MRIVCDSCATRYAIDDARLPDRPFKVRCKRCQKNIVVRRKSRPRWHLAPAGQEVGPLTTAEVREGLATGAIDEGTHAWREGMQSWETLDRVHELRPVRESGRPGLFDHLSAPDEPLVAAGERNSALPATGGVPLVASRNEASVLFSIANLRDLAGGGATPDPRGGSGLIDIRAFAPPPAEQLLASGVVVPAAPLLVAAEAPPHRTWLLPTAVGLGAALLVALGLLLVLVLLQPRAAVATEPPDLPTPAPPAAVKPTPPPAPPATVKPGPAVKAPPERPPHRLRRPRRPPTVKPRGKHPPRTAKKTRVAARPEQEDELTRLIRAATGGQPARPGPSPAPRPATEPLPALEKHQITAGVRGVRGQVRACFERYRVPGTAWLKLTISPGGKMARAKVQGVFAGTPTGACLEQAFLGARFPRFRGPALTVRYPVILR